MEKILEFEKDGVVFAVLTESLSKNEVFVDGAYEISVNEGIAKLRFFSSTGIVRAAKRMVENNLSIVMNEQTMLGLCELLSEACQDLMIAKKETRNKPASRLDEEETEYVEIASFK